MKKNKIKLLALELWPFLIGIIIMALFWRQEILASILILVIIIIMFSIKYEKNEIYLYFLGVLIGAIVELWGQLIVHFQNFTQGLLLGMPLWLPLVWGYAFIAMRRIGNLIVK